MKLGSLGLGAVLALLPLTAHAVELADAPNLAGAIVGVESTPVLGAYYARLGKGFWEPGAATSLAFTGAMLTGFRGGRLHLERDEVVLRAGRRTLRGLLGSGFAFSADAAGSYRAWTALAGLRFTYEVARWELGVRFAYLPVLVTHVRFTDSQRDTFAERYPQGSSELGPPSVNVWLPGQRLEALLMARASLGAWLLELAGGLEFSPGAGRNWTNLQLGQLPLVLRVATGRRF